MVENGPKKGRVMSKDMSVFEQSTGNARLFTPHATLRTVQTMEYLFLNTIISSRQMLAFVSSPGARQEMSWSGTGLGLGLMSSRCESSSSQLVLSLRPSTRIESSDCGRTPLASRVYQDDAAFPTTLAGTLRDHDPAHTRARKRTQQ